MHLSLQHAVLFSMTQCRFNVCCRDNSFFYIISLSLQVFIKFSNCIVVGGRWDFTELEVKARLTQNSRNEEILIILHLYFVIV